MRLTRMVGPFGPVVVLAVFVLLVSLALPAGPASAESGPDLYLSAAGLDTAACTRTEPCRTVQHAVAVAGSDRTTIWIGTGTYDGAIDVPAGRNLLLLSLNDGPTPVLTDTDGTSPMITVEGSLGVSGLDVDAPGTAFQERLAPPTPTSATSLDFDGTVLRSGDEGVDNNGGLLIVDQSRFDLPASATAAIRSAGGSVELSHVAMAAPLITSNAHVDATELDMTGVSDAVQLDGGHSQITQSYFDDDPRAVRASGAAVVDIDSSSFQSSSPAVLVDSAQALVTVVRDTVLGVPTGPALEQSAGELRVAGTAIIGAVPSCVGMPVDGGYNRAADSTCNFSAVGSENSVGGFGLRLETGGPYNPSLIPDGPDSPQFAPGPYSPLVDQIPAGTAATFASTSALCPGGSAPFRADRSPCEIGATDLAPPTVTLTVGFHDGRGLSPNYDDDPTPITVQIGFASYFPGPTLLPTGTVVLQDNRQLLPPRCRRIPFADLYNSYPAGEITCYADLLPGPHRIQATFVPSNAYHAESAATRAFVRRAVTTTFVHANGRRIDHQRPTRLIMRVEAGSSPPTGRLSVTIAGRRVRGCVLPRLQRGRAVCWIRPPYELQRLRVKYFGTARYAPSFTSEYLELLG